MQSYLLLCGALLAGGQDTAPYRAQAPTVSLEVTSPELGGLADLRDRELLEILIMRLLEDGYRVLPTDGDGADVEISIRATPQGAWLEAQGRAVETAFVPAGDAAIVSLELRQWTSALVDRVRPSQVGEAPFGITVDLQGTSAWPASELYAGLLARGLPVTASPTADDKRLCVRWQGGAWLSWIASDGLSCEREPEDVSTTWVVGGEDRDRDDMLDAVAGTLGERRDVSTEPVATLQTSSSATDQGRVRREPPVEDLVEAAWRHEPLVFSVAAHGGVIVRSRVDGTVGARVRVGRRRAVGGGLEVELIPSEAIALRVLEITTQGFLDWRFQLRRRGFLAVALAGGLYVHRYSQTADLGHDGQVFGGSACTRSSFGFSSRAGVFMEISAGAGLRFGTPTHFYDGRPSWYRPGLFLGLGASVGWDVRLASGAQR